MKVASFADRSGNHNSFQLGINKAGRWSGHLEGIDRWSRLWWLSNVRIHLPGLKDMACIAPAKTRDWEHFRLLRISKTLTCLMNPMGGVGSKTTSVGKRC